jgi:hypothetical protein
MLAYDEALGQLAEGGGSKPRYRARAGRGSGLAERVGMTARRARRAGRIELAAG